MKSPLLQSLVIAVLCVGNSFGQSRIELATETFASRWDMYSLPNCSYTVYHGTEGWYFTDSLGKKVPNHLYLELKGGGYRHFIVRDKSGYHLLNTELQRVTKKPYTEIKRLENGDFELVANGVYSYYVYKYEGDSFEFSIIPGPPAPAIDQPVLEYTPPLELGKVVDSKFKPKRIERLRTGIDLTKTLTHSKKGKNFLVHKNGTIVYKGLTKPMLYYDFVIAKSKAPFTIHHPAYKKVFLSNCEQFWFVDSFLVVAFQGSAEKWIVSNSGDVILKSLGEIRYYEYEHGGEHFSFFCDGRDVVNRNGAIIYHSDGELIGIGEHYIYANNLGGYLGDLTQPIQLMYTNFERFGTMSMAQMGKNEWCALSPDSVLLTGVNDYFNRDDVGTLFCVNESETYTIDTAAGKLLKKHPFLIALKPISHGTSKYYIEQNGKDELPRFGIYDIRDGVITEAKFRCIRHYYSSQYYIVFTENGEVEYLNSEGQELFD